MRYKVVIPTSGIGSRLGEFTEFTNKSLAPIGEKPAICHIVDLYPAEIEIVMLLGHYGSHVKQLLELAYPKRNFSFVEVDNYAGEGSSLVYSVLRANNIVDCPFILHACDTIIRNAPVPIPSRNWLGGSHCPYSSQYTTFDVAMETVVQIHEKGEKNYDYAFIGMAGIYDFADFFSRARKMHNERKADSQLSNIHVHAEQIKNGLDFSCCVFDEWFDVGNIDSLNETRRHFPSRISSIPKKNETIYIIGSRVVKFFSDEMVAKKRVARANILGNVVPKIQASKVNFYSYEYVEGDSLATVATPKIIDQLLHWARDSLWRMKPSNDNFINSCRRFYCDKTMARVAEFCDIYGFKDEPSRINGLPVPSAKSLVESLPSAVFDKLVPSSFHGDFILDNIVYTLDKRFVLTDWRQDFAGSTMVGDIYYDMAKLNCSFVFNQKLISKNYYRINEKYDEQIYVDIYISSNLLDCQKSFMEFIKYYGYNLSVVSILTPIVWLNMAPLHEHPLSSFLYYYGRLKLHSALNKIGEIYAS